MSRNKNATSEPLVAIVTPLYNGEKYIAGCIESILAQTYQNWEYVVVNNCSTDDSLKIAQNYAKQDSRIRIDNNKKFLPVVDNFNHSMLQISDQSKYCKVIHSDDLLFPHCIAEMVSLAEKNPSIGIVGSYVLEGVRVKCDGLPYANSVFSGRHICGWTLLGKSPVNGGLYVFGSPTTLLIRSDLVRSRKPFYNDRYLQVVDQEACYCLLQNTDFGFVHQVLTFSGLHANSVTSSTATLNRRILEELMLLVEYGPVYLNKNDYEKRLSQRKNNYYSFLAASMFERKPEGFWQFHRKGFKSLELQFSKRKMAIAALRKLVRRLLVFSAHPIKFFHTKTRSLNITEQ